MSNKSEENVYLYIDRIEIDPKMRSTPLARIPRMLKEGEVYRAIKFDGEESYEIMLDDSTSVMVNMETFSNRDESIPEMITEFKVREIDFENMVDFDIDESQINQMLDWESDRIDLPLDIDIAEEEELDIDMAVGEVDEHHLNREIPTMNEMRDVVRGMNRKQHPAYSLPMSFVKLKMYELRDSNPDMFYSIFQTIEIYLKDHYEG